MIAIDDVIQKKSEAADALVSQVYETVYGVDAATRAQRLAAIPKDPEARRGVAQRRMGSSAPTIANR